MSVIEDFLAKLGANTKITVGVSVSPVVGLEMIEIDRTTGNIEKYAHKPLEYNQSSREISDYFMFESSLLELFEELKISPNSNVVLSLPTVHFGIAQLPILLNDEMTTNAILSEVEQSYIFKRQEPVISWSEVASSVNTENKTIVYTAIQEAALTQIKEACDNVGCTLVGIEPSYSSLLKTLHYAKLTEEQMKENITWNLMVVGQNSYSIIAMTDKKVLEYYEEPLALKSFVDNEIYNAITTSAQLTLSGMVANYLYIVSETDLVSAEVLSMKISFPGKVKFLESNKFTQKELLPTNLNILPKSVLQITPEVIGAALYPFSNFPLKLNLIKEKESELFASDVESFPKIPIGNLEVELTPSFVRMVCLILGSIFIIPMFALSLFLSYFLIPREKTKLENINFKIKQTQLDISHYKQKAKTDTFDVNSAVESILTQDQSKLAYLSALGVSIPNKLWVTYYRTQGKGIDIRGKASNVQSIYDFYKNMKQMVNNSDIRLYKLEFSSESIDDIIGITSSVGKTYNFEITNMTETELNPAAPASQGQPPAPSAQNPNPAQTPPKPQENKPFQFGKPLFGPAQNNPAPTPAPGQPPAEQLPNNLQKIEHF